MEKINVLAICVHNSARSQMTEEYIRFYGNDIIKVESAGIIPGSINPIVIELLKEDNIDISGKSTQSVADLHKKGRTYEYVIAVCDPEAAEACPIFPSEKERLHWPFPDPSEAVGPYDKKKKYVRTIRDRIRDSSRSFVEELRGNS